MEEAKFIFGNEPLGRRPNVRAELARIRRDPLQELLPVIGAEPPKLLSDDRSRYEEAFLFYYLSLHRYLRDASIAARYSVEGLRWLRKRSLNQRRLAEKYRNVRPFLEFDLVNCLLHTRILLDRVAALSRHFLRGQRLPSFTSFNDHKKFFRKLEQPYGKHEEYAKYIRNHTNWFDMPLKEVRDKFVVHSSPKHLRLLGYPDGGYELHLNIWVPDNPNADRALEKTTLITVNPLRMSYDVEAFLKWFCRYGLAACGAPGRERDQKECVR
jgi:hypothetical protein